MAQVTFICVHHCCVTAATHRRSITTLPLVIKGVLCAEDALKAAQHGATAIIVSNHGGRQLDCAPVSVMCPVLYDTTDDARPRRTAWPPLHGPSNRSTPPVRCLWTAVFAAAVTSSKPSPWAPMPC